MAQPTKAVLGGGIVINEILVDPNSKSRNFDTDNNGSAATTDEFVELLSTAATLIDVGDYQFLGRSLQGIFRTLM